LLLEHFVHCCLQKINKLTYVSEAFGCTHYSICPD
jgi:hypothetical protein